MPFTVHGEERSTEERLRHARIAGRAVAGGPRTPAYPGEGTCCETESGRKEREALDRYEVALAGGLPERTDEPKAAPSTPWALK